MPTMADVRATVAAVVAKYPIIGPVTVYDSISPTDPWLASVRLGNGNIIGSSTFQDESQIRMVIGNQFDRSYMAEFMPLAYLSMLPPIATPPQSFTTNYPQEAQAPITTASGQTYSQAQVAAANQAAEIPPAINTGSSTRSIVETAADDGTLEGGLRTADQWAYSYHNVRPDITLPAPEDYGFTGSGRFQRVDFDSWWRSLVRAFPQYANPPAPAGGSRTMIGAGPGPATVTAPPAGSATSTSILGPMSRQDKILLAVGVGLVLLLVFGGGRRA